jgi:hypothetical protein
MASSLLIYEAKAQRIADQEMQGWFTPEDRKLILLANDLQGQVEENTDLMSCLPLTMKNKHFCSSLE